MADAKEARGGADLVGEARSIATDIKDRPGRALSASLPYLTGFPFFGGQVMTAIVVIVVVTQSKALSHEDVVLLSVAGLGLVLLHSILGSRAEAVKLRAVATVSGLAISLTATVIALSVVLIKAIR